MTEPQAQYQVTRSEHDEQVAFVMDILYRYASRPDFSRPLFSAIINGAMLGGANVTARMGLVRKYKAEGWTPGLFDILYLQPRGIFPYLAIEMKTRARRSEKRGGLSVEQSEFMDAATNAGACAMVCYGADEAVEVFDNYMRLEQK